MDIEKLSKTFGTYDYLQQLTLSTGAAVLLTGIGICLNTLVGVAEMGISKGIFRYRAIIIVSVPCLVSALTVAGRVKTVTAFEAVGQTCLLGSVLILLAARIYDRANKNYNKGGKKDNKFQNKD